MYRFFSSANIQSRFGPSGRSSRLSKIVRNAPCGCGCVEDIFSSATASTTSAIPLATVEYAWIAVNTPAPPPPPPPRPPRPPPPRAGRTASCPHPRPPPAPSVIAAQVLDDLQGVAVRVGERGEARPAFDLADVRLEHHTPCLQGELGRVEIVDAQHDRAARGKPWALTRAVQA